MSCGRTSAGLVTRSFERVRLGEATRGFRRDLRLITRGRSGWCGRRGDGRRHGVCGSGAGGSLREPAAAAELAQGWLMGVSFNAIQSDRGELEVAGEIGQALNLGCHHGGLDFQLLHSSLWMTTSRLVCGS